MKHRTRPVAFKKISKKVNIFYLKFYTMHKIE
jgi:hypothetical protein